MNKITIDLNKAKQILNDNYDMEGKLTLLDGELDANFKVETEDKVFLLKISRPNADLNNIRFQSDLLQYLNLF